MKHQPSKDERSQRDKKNPSLILKTPSLMHIGKYIFMRHVMLTRKS